MTNRIMSRKEALQTEKDEAQDLDLQQTAAVLDEMRGYERALEREVGGFPFPFFQSD